MHFIINGQDFIDKETAISIRREKYRGESKISEISDKLNDAIDNGSDIKVKNSQGKISNFKYEKMPDGTIYVNNPTSDYL